MEKSKSALLALPYNFHHEVCFNNCRIHHGEKLYKCTGCNIALYCTTLCQKEHWYSTHREHCKFLNGTKKLPTQCFHDDDNCLDCQGTNSHSIAHKTCPYKIIKRPTELYKNKFFRCLMNTKNNQSYSRKDLVKIQTMNLPVELGEYTGSYVDSIDRTLGEAITISGNLIHLKYSKSSFHENVLKVVDFLMNIRVVYWRSLMSNKSQLFPILFHWNWNEHLANIMFHLSFTGITGASCCFEIPELIGLNKPKDHCSKASLSLCLFPLFSTFGASSYDEIIKMNIITFLSWLKLVVKVKCVTKYL